MIGEGFLSFDKQFLCECKNYNSRINVTWIGKFYSLLKTSENQLGILFSFKGFSGSKWNSSVGLSKKIILRDKTKIIDFSIDDFNKLTQGFSFIEIVTDKIYALENDVEYSKLITLHPNEDIISK